MPSWKKVINKKFFIISLTIAAIVIVIVILYFSGLYEVARYELGDKTSLKVSLHAMAPGITSISAESQNEMGIEALVTDPSGNPVPAAKVILEEKNGIGAFSYLSERTSKNGALVVIYSPPEQSACLKTKASADITISARLFGTNSEASLTFKLVRVPIVFVHGYKASPTIFDNFNAYMKAAGFMTAGLDYDSGLGVASGAAQLDAFLGKLSIDYARKGILTTRFDIISHSMGGLVSRYYTCSQDYMAKSNVSKIIFLSTPQKGSPFASLGLKYYKDRGIYDLMPDSELYTKTFLSMFNGGLNSTIRTASILGQYDEVVSTDSASLERWGIKTEVFHVGESNFTVDKLLTGKIVEAANHKLVLDNLKVYRRVEELLLSGIPYPEKVH